LEAKIHLLTQWLMEARIQALRIWTRGVPSFTKFILQEKVVVVRKVVTWPAIFRMDREVLRGIKTPSSRTSTSSQLITDRKTTQTVVPI